MKIIGSSGSHSTTLKVIEILECISLLGDVRTIKIWIFLSALNIDTERLGFQISFHNNINPVTIVHNFFGSNKLLYIPRGYFKRSNMVKSELTKSRDVQCINIYWNWVLLIMFPMLHLQNLPTITIASRKFIMGRFPIIRRDPINLVPVDLFSFVPYLHIRKSKIYVIHWPEHV